MSKSDRGMKRYVYRVTTLRLKQRYYIVASSLAEATDRAVKRLTIVDSVTRLGPVL